MLSSPSFAALTCCQRMARRTASPSGRSCGRPASRRRPPSRWSGCRRSPSARRPQSRRRKPGSGWSSPADQVLRQLAGAQAGFRGDLDIAVPLLQKRFSACISLMSSSPCTLSTSTALRRVDSWADCFASSASFFCSSRPGRTMITAATGAIHASCGAMIASTTTNSKRRAGRQSSRWWTR